MFLNLGIRGKLLLAFIAISIFSLLTAGFAVYTVVRLTDTVDRITGERIPVAFAAQKISQRTERVAALGPALLAADSQERRELLIRLIDGEKKEILTLIPLVDQSGSTTSRLQEIKPELGVLVANLDSLARSVELRVMAADHKATLLARLGETNIAAHRLLAPDLLLLDMEVGRLTKMKRTEQNIPFSKGEYLEKFVQRYPLLKVEDQLAVINDTLLRTASASSTELDVLAFTLKRALLTIEELIRSLQEPLRSRLRERLVEYRGFASGSNSLLAARRSELEILLSVTELLEHNAESAKRLAKISESVVTATAIAMEDAANEASTIGKNSLKIIIAIVCISLLCSVLVAWLYVSRSIVARLRVLGESMQSISAGDLDVEVPEATTDEIGQMAKALRVFHDTAVEVKQTNLVEIRQARQRLVEAIESLSEGFSLYDREDRLVVCNSRYKNNIFPQIAESIQPGVPFETVARAAVEAGAIAEMENSADIWIKDRLARHRDPDGPFILRLADKRWIQVDESITSEGNTVALYSDLTVIKDHEQQLAEKTQALEHLSKQLAKFLSPQVYQSIFESGQEVKVASKRKKLTVFFSDIAGFTEIADRLESEELTRLINHYLTEMSRIALECGGTIDKYMGDGIMIFFGDPESRGTKADALSCVEMAISMRERLGSLAEIWHQRGIEEPLRVRMGIHTGYCTVGNFGSEDRMDYTIMGGGANTASRLETAADSDEILISQETFTLVRDVISCRERGSIQLKGMAYPVSSYAVIGRVEEDDKDRACLDVNQPNLSVRVDMSAMTHSEIEQGISTLKQAEGLLEKLLHENDKKS